MTAVKVHPDIEIVREIGKDQVAYDRQVAICGKKAADNVLYFWMEGFKYRDQHIYPDSPWIKVKDRLPNQEESLGMILVSHLSGQKYVTTPAVIQWSKNNVFKFIEMDWETEIKNVEAWMSMPQYKKED